MRSPAFAAVFKPPKCATKCKSTCCVAPKKKPKLRLKQPAKKPRPKQPLKRKPSARQKLPPPKLEKSARQSKRCSCPGWQCSIQSHGQSLYSGWKFTHSKTRSHCGRICHRVQAGLAKEADTGSYSNWRKNSRTNHPINDVNWHDATAYCCYIGYQITHRKRMGICR